MCWRDHKGGKKRFLEFGVGKGGLGLEEYKIKGAAWGRAGQ